MEKPSKDEAIFQSRGRISAVRIKFSLAFFELSRYYSGGIKLVIGTSYVHFFGILSKHRAGKILDLNATNDALASTAKREHANSDRQSG